MKRKKIEVQDVTISWHTIEDEDFISLTDMVRGQERHEMIIQNWMRTASTLTF